MWSIITANLDTTWPDTHKYFILSITKIFPLLPVLFSFSPVTHLFSSQLEQTLLEHRKPERHKHFASVVGVHFSAYSVDRQALKPQDFQVPSGVLSLMYCLKCISNITGLHSGSMDTIFSESDVFSLTLLA